MNSSAWPDIAIVVIWDEGGAGMTTWRRRQSILRDWECARP